MGYLYQVRDCSLTQFEQQNTSMGKELAGGSLKIETK